MSKDWRKKNRGIAEFFGQQANRVDADGPIFPEYHKEPDLAMKLLEALPEEQEFEGRIFRKRCEFYADKICVGLVNTESDTDTITHRWIIYGEHRDLYKAIVLAFESAIENNKVDIPAGID